jgi:superfamily II DNA or RNA helicase/HKD family nuclease
MLSSNMTSDPLDPGLREELVTTALEARLHAIDAKRVERRALDVAESRAFVIRQAEALVAEWLRTTSDPDPATLTNQLAANLGAELLARYELLTPAELLTGILPISDGLTAPVLPDRPQVPLTANELLVNDRKQPSIGSQLKAELQSATRVDLICAFIMWSGVVTLLDELRGVVGRDGAVRVITTTYMGVTDPKAVRALSELGAEVRIGFDAQRTKLHAKAWIMERPHGLTTAFVGSSNLSRTAMHAGLEWNVRLAEAEAASVIDRMRATFDTYWDDDAFEEYEPDRDAERLEQALGRQRQGKAQDITSPSFSGLDVVPYPHQRRMLEDLMVQRDRHDRHRNLVVAATGTGKTVIAALDYKELVNRAKRPLRLLFVAHREQILNQSRATFRAALKDPSFGEILGGGHSPRDGRHLFAMIQSLRRKDVEAIDPQRFDVVIVDEFHHAEAPSYAALLEHLQPAELVGLTATPERMDGGDVTRWFGGRIAVELRVWEAIDRGYLAPFQYFGVSDTEDLSNLTWRRGGYDVAQLDNLFTGNDIRARRVVEAIEHWHASPNTMRALGFCVSIAHAEFMAAQFSKFDLDSVAISGFSSEGERQTALQDLRAGRIRCIFSVDVLGEGVDVPNVDTVLLLRPTQSATVFAQQLGRGLRLSEDKPGLTVIDLVGQQHKRFRFEDRLRAIVDESNGSMRRQAEEGFPYLPSGCSITLDEHSREIVLTNLRLAATATQWRTLVEELKELGDVELDVWARETGRRISDLYRQPDRSWTRLRRDAGLPTAQPAPGEDPILRSMRRLDHIDDPERTGFYFDVLTNSERPDSTSFTTRQQRLLTMLLRGLGVDQKDDSLDSALKRLWPHSAVRDELVELFMALDDRSERDEQPLEASGNVPVALHAQYTRVEALLAFGDGVIGEPSAFREGVRWLPDAATDLLFVTLRKSERSFSPTTMYRDYALSRSLFHWESQNATHDDTPTGRRYINHVAMGTKIILFVRESETRTNGAGSAFTCLGPVRYVSHVGNRPMQVTWELEHRLPEALLETSQLVAAA